MSGTPDPHKGQDTRTRLLRAALAVFGHRDFDAVSIREIVRHADANVAAVSYHFGGKQGLYLATAEFLAEALQERLGPLLAQIDTGTGDARSAAALLERLIHALVHTLLTDGLGDDAAGFILREQHQPTAAFDILYDRLMLPMQQGYQRLAARVSGGTPPPARAGILGTHALMGQILVFRMARTTVLRRLDQADFSEGDAQEIAATITRLTLQSLRADHRRDESS